MNGQILRPGDPCPCCGEPIKTDDPDVLLTLSWVAWLKGHSPKSRPENGAAGQG